MVLKRLDLRAGVQYAESNLRESLPRWQQNVAKKSVSMSFGDFVSLLILMQKRRFFFDQLGSNCERRNT
jgi:hypothetical protein